MCTSLGLAPQWNPVRPCVLTGELNARCGASSAADATVTPNSYPYFRGYFPPLAVSSARAAGAAARPTSAARNDERIEQLEIQHAIARGAGAPETVEPDTGAPEGSAPVFSDDRPLPMAGGAWNQGPARRRGDNDPWRISQDSSGPGASLFPSSGMAVCSWRAPDGGNRSQERKPGGQSDRESRTMPASEKHLACCRAQNVRHYRPVSAQRQMGGQNLGEPEALLSRYIRYQEGSLSRISMRRAPSSWGICEESRAGIRRKARRPARFKMTEQPAMGSILRTSFSWGCIMG